jgi:tRNA modification GTPase
LSANFSHESIVALASAAGRAGVAVIRLSGPQAREALRRTCFPSDLPSPRHVALRRFVDFRTGELVDHALVLFFPGPNSFTGEDVAEFQVHGGRAVVATVLEVLCAIDGIRPADPGEFSRRAFENSKMDLTEAEAIADLVDAETAAQRRQALRQMDGELGALYTGWADRIKYALAFIEAEIDFADEDIPEDITKDRLSDMKALAQEMETHLNDEHRGERLRDGFMVALLGAPNAGKSSILNKLARREAAIVDPTPGTTRDIIECQLDLGGYPVTFADTAGLRETVDAIENEGVRRALHRAQQADIKLLVFDGTKDPQQDTATWSLRDDHTFLVINKMDQVVAPDVLRQSLLNEPRTVFVCATSGEGLSELVERLVLELNDRYAATTAPALTRTRHRLAVQEALDHIQRALSADQSELCAEDLRLAMRAVGRITGRVDVEDLLDVIFSSFCIGK